MIFIVAFVKETYISPLYKRMKYQVCSLGQLILSNFEEFYLNVNFHDESYKMDWIPLVFKQY